jgi:hypothetical protein
MPSTGLSGPYTLSGERILATVTSNGSPGAYALGDSRSDGTFVVRYVGRSDSDIAARLQDWVGSYKQFKFGYLSTAEAAFAKECNLYHDFGPEGLDNTVHPAKPTGSKSKCPRCGQ